MTVLNPQAMPLELNTNTNTLAMEGASLPIECQQLHTSQMMWSNQPTDQQEYLIITYQVEKKKLVVIK